MSDDEAAELRMRLAHIAHHLVKQTTEALGEHGIHIAVVLFDDHGTVVAASSNVGDHREALETMLEAMTENEGVADA